MKDSKPMLLIGHPSQPLIQNEEKSNINDQDESLVKDISERFYNNSEEIVWIRIIHNWLRMCIFIQVSYFAITRPSSENELLLTSASETEKLRFLYRMNAHL